MADLAAAIRQAEEALARHESPIETPTCHICGSEMTCHYSGPDGTRWYCGDPTEAVNHWSQSEAVIRWPNHEQALALALRTLLAAAREAAHEIEQYRGVAIACEARAEKAESSLLATRNSLVTAREANRVLTGSRDRAEAALAEEREKLAKAERRGEKAAVALARAHEVIAQQRSLIDPEEYPEIDAAAGEVIDPCDEFADRMDRAETELRIVNDERDRLREQLAEERRRREEAEAIIRRILDAHDARLSERGHLVYGHPSMGTGFPEAIRFLAGAPVPFARRLRERVDVAPPCPYCGAYASRCNADRDDGSTVCAMTGRTVRPAEGASK